MSLAKKSRGRTLSSDESKLGPQARALSEDSCKVAGCGTFIGLFYFSWPFQTFRAPKICMTGLESHHKVATAFFTSALDPR